MPFSVQRQKVGGHIWNKFVALTAERSIKDIWNFLKILTRKLGKYGKY
jgi:hypothetical protein